MSLKKRILSFIIAAVFISTSVSAFAAGSEDQIKLDFHLDPII